MKILQIALYRSFISIEMRIRLFYESVLVILPLTRGFYPTSSSLQLAQKIVPFG